jgi:hypothetical protein
MTANYGSVIIGVTGGITFTNEWLQKGDNGIQWAIIPWTAIGMLGFSLLGAVSPFLGNTLAATALLTELMVPFHGRKPPLTALLSALPKET